MTRFLPWAASLLLVTACHSRPSPALLGTYQLTFMGFAKGMGPTLEQQLIFTPDHAILQTGGVQVLSAYVVEANKVYLVSADEKTRVGYQILSPDTLRYQGPGILETLYYIRVRD